MSGAARGRGTTPVHLVTGVHTSAMAATTIGLQWDLPDAVVVEHRIDPDHQRLVRVVSDRTGRLEEEVVDLEHACVSCAIREDMVPTLDRLGEIGRWSSVVAHLAAGAEASQVCRVAGFSEGSLSFHVASVVASFEGDGLGDVLLGDDLLADTPVPTLPEEDRGLAEVAVPILEYADLVVVQGRRDPVGHDAVRALARPGALVLRDSGEIDAQILQQGVHHHATTEDWVSDVRRGPVPTPQTDEVWTMDLSADRPVHPRRLEQRFEDLGVGSHRARGCLWVATRPGDVIGWDGAGGQHRLGPVATWGALGGPMTRVVVTGRRDDDRRSAIRGAFADCLLTDAELSRLGPRWEQHQDGLEPWLGPIRRVA
ncbi:GTP-binding protein [Serinicoccus sediminis]|uniref:GTP-binding protein n=1 Tax=Serinicoccus sediminis TaxID=2306021 RepID=UPI00192DADFA|nr:GTP-binding protein [Serinicoccus sediminis]